MAGIYAEKCGGVKGFYNSFHFAALNGCNCMLASGPFGHLVFASMPIRSTTGLLLVIVMLCSSGCSSLRSKAKEKPAIVPRQPALVGTVALVNLESQFVLIDNGLLPTPPVGLVLKSYTAGVESAELVTSAARRRPFTIADIRQGIPRKGDRVFVASAAVLPAQPVPQTDAPSGNNPAPVEPDFLPPVQLSPTP